MAGTEQSGNVLRAALYVRVSTSGQDAENQLLQLRPFCERNGWIIETEYVDIISGMKDNRPAYDQMFGDAHRNKFDILVFWDLSRFSRSGTLFTLQKLRELENLGIKWHSFNEPYFSSIGEFRDVIISIMATLAKIEREKISERTKAGLARARRNGKRLGKRPKKINFKQVWEEYERQGSINKTAKVLPVGYGTTWRIITNNIHSQSDWESFNYGQRKAR